VQDIFIACVDGLKGFLYALRGYEVIETVYPQTAVQLCIVHWVRNSLNTVGWKMRKQIVDDLKRIYQLAAVAEAEQQLAEF
jgi:putative transposase